MSPRQLSIRLGEFGIVPGTIRLTNGTTPKGYYLEKFRDAFARYLSATAVQSATPPQPSSSAASSNSRIRHKDDMWRMQKAMKPSNDAGCGGVADRGRVVSQEAVGSGVTAWDEGVI